MLTNLNIYDVASDREPDITAEFGPSPLDRHVTVYVDHGTDRQRRVRVNWSALGSQDLATTCRMVACLAEAMAFAQTVLTASAGWLTEQTEMAQAARGAWIEPQR